MFDKMKELMELKKQADRIKRELDGIVVDVEEVRGIKIAITASQEFRSVTIDDSLVVVGRKAEFERELLRSINAATKKSQQVAAQKMAGAMGGMG